MSDKALSWMPLVRRLAADVHVRRRRSGGVPLAELEQAGAVGLLAAIQRRDPAKGDFQSYAKRCIWCAIMDCLRSYDSAPRTVRKGRRDAEAARERLLARLCRPPTTEEIARDLGIGVDSYHSLERRELEASRVPFDEDALPCDSADPSRIVERGESLEKIFRALRDLPERERAVVRMRHREEQPFHAIARAIGRTEGRAWQIYDRALNRVRDQLNIKVEVRNGGKKVR